MNWKKAKMDNKIITLESKKYELRLDNFEGPLDVLVYLIDKNKMNIYDISIAEIADVALFPSPYTSALYAFSILSHLLSLSIA